MSNERLEQIKAFLNRSDFKDAMLHPLAGDASFRRYIRIRKGDRSAMLMDAPPEKENVRPYIAIAQHLHGKGYSAPEILAQDATAGLLLLEDLGDDSFTSVLKKSAGMESELYEAAIDVLAQWHDEKRRVAHPQSLALPHYDEALLLKEVSLFADWYLPQAIGKEAALSLREDYMQMWEEILRATPLSTHIWVHRDYHADNLMWLPKRDGTKRIGLLDFQDGVYGDGAYDLVSLIEDARRDVPQTIADAMIARYITASGADREKFLATYAILGAQRNSKIIGIFSRLAARDNKFSYLQFLPRVWRHFERDLTHPSLQTLKAWIDRHVPHDQRGVITLKHSSQELLSA